VAAAEAADDGWEFDEQRSLVAPDAFTARPAQETRSLPTLSRATAVTGFGFSAGLESGLPAEPADDGDGVHLLHGDKSRETFRQSSPALSPSSGNSSKVPSPSEDNRLISLEFGGGGTGGALRALGLHRNLASLAAAAVRGATTGLADTTVFAGDETPVSVLLHSCPSGFATFSSDRVPVLIPSPTPSTHRDRAAATSSTAGVVASTLQASTVADSLL